MKRLFRRCGHAPGALSHRFVLETPYNWKRIWQRARMSDDGMPNPHWPADWPVGCGTGPLECG